MNPEESYGRGWKAACVAVTRMLAKEAGACIGDIVPGDEIGAKLANARAGALLTAQGDVREMIDKIRMPQRDFIDITGGPDAPGDKPT